MDNINTNETIELPDLEPIDEMKGGGWTGNINLNGNATIGATGTRRLDGFVVRPVDP